MVTAITFCKFPHLPYDLRYRIYLFATPPRLVYIEEGFPVEDNAWEVKDDKRFEWDDDEPGEAEAAFLDFSKQLHHGPLQFKLKLHPDLVYFAENWRTRMPESFLQPTTQTTLEEYGFTSNKEKLPEPWTPTSWTPLIAVDRLHENPRLAFELARETWLYSETPIPAFLHVCTESRRALKNFGYQLAFSTRSHPPRTWFHFERDILYAPQPLEDCTYDPVADFCAAYYNSPKHFTSVLSGCPWDIGRIDLSTLRNLTRLILPGTWSHVSDRDLFPTSLHYLARVIKLLPNLKEILLEDWEDYDIGGWFFDTVGWMIPWNHEGSRVLNRACEPRVCIPWEPIDSIGSMCWFGSSRVQGDHVVGPPPDKLHYTMDTNLPPLPRIADHSRHWNRQDVAQRLRAELRTILQQQDCFRNPLPEIAFAHTCPESLAQRFLRGRHQFWQDFSFLQKQAQDETRLELPHPVVQEPRFRVNFDKIRLEARTSIGALSIETRAWRWLERVTSGWERDQAPDALIQWFFRGPSISEPGLNPL